MAIKDRYWTITEAAKQFNVTRQTISRWITEGKVSVEKVGRETLIKKADLQKYLLERYTEAAKASVLNLYKAIAEGYGREKGYSKEGEEIIIGYNNGFEFKSHIPGEAIDEITSRFAGGFLQSLGIDKTKFKSPDEAMDEVKKRIMGEGFIQSIETYTTKFKSPNNKIKKIRRERKKEK